MADKGKSKDKDEDAKIKGKGGAPAADEGDESAEGEEGEGGGEKKGLDAKKIVLFIVLPLFLLIGIGAGLYFTGILDGVLKKGGSEHSAEAGKDGGDENSKTAAIPSAFFLKIPDMLVNLSSTDGQPRYLRLSVQLELSSQMDMKAVEAVMPRVVDQFQTYLRELRIKDLRGSQGIYRLQTELLSRVNAAAYPVEVKDVLFQEILIQ